MPKAPQKIALAMLGKRTPLDQMRNLLGTPHPPHEIALAISGEESPLDQMRNFAGTPGGADAHAPVIRRASAPCRA
jgi:hypothetical protein